MTHSQSFWTWQLDSAASHVRARLTTGIALVAYLAGAILLLAQLRLGLSQHWWRAGIALVLIAIAGSVLICARIVLVRSRRLFRS